MTRWFRQWRLARLRRDLAATLERAVNYRRLASLHQTMAAGTDPEVSHFTWSWNTDLANLQAYEAAKAQRFVVTLNVKIKRLQRLENTACT